MQSESPEKLAKLSALGAALQLDSAGAEVATNFQRAGVESLLLKGRSFARWLYTDGRERPYRDVDLLVSDVAAAQRTLLSLGYRLEFNDCTMPGWWREHAGTWFRPSDGTTIDLHRTLPGVSAPDDVVWRALWGEAELMSIGGADVRVLSVRARALHVVLHAAQHGAAWDWPMADLERALVVCDQRLWRRAADLATELGALDAFVAGLNLLPVGAAVGERLGLRMSWSVDAHLRANSAPAPALTIEQLAAADGFRARLVIGSRKVLPPPDFIRHWDPRAAGSRTALVRAYVRRALWLLRVAPRSFRAWRRAREAASPDSSYRR